MKPALYLYTTQGCHLCEQAEEIVRPLLVRYGLVLELIEIAGSEELMERYGLRIPVLRLSGATAELGWPFDAAAAEAFIRGT